MADEVRDERRGVVAAARSTERRNTVHRATAKALLDAWTRSMGETPPSAS